MKRKRLNHFGDAVIGILTGYRMIEDYDCFHKKGPGLYALDLLKGKCTFNNEEMDAFPVFAYIRNWFANETKKHKIDLKLIAQAVVILEVSKPQAPEKIKIIEKKWFFFKRTYEIDSYQYQTRIKCMMKTDEHDYSKETTGAIWN